MNLHDHQTQEQIKHIGDAVAGAGTTAALMGWVPELTAVATLLWVLLRLYETKAVQDLIAYMKARK